MFSFLKQNGFVKQRILKRFTYGVSSVLENTSMMRHVINKARLKQCSVVFTLLDLKNAFGEVHHNLICTVLSYHHIPQTVQLLIANLYTGFYSCILSVSLLWLFSFSVECCRLFVLNPIGSTCALTQDRARKLY